MIRQYARERLAEHDEPAALPERHARWYAELAQEPGVTAAGAEARRLACAGWIAIRPTSVPR